MSITPVVPDHPPNLAPDGGSFGREMRLMTGAVLLLGNLLLMYVDVSSGESVTWQDVALHGALFLTSLLLMDPRRTIDLLSMVKDKIPFVGSK